MIVFGRHSPPFAVRHMPQTAQANTPSKFAARAFQPQPALSHRDRVALRVKDLLYLTVNNEKKASR